MTKTTFKPGIPTMGFINELENVSTIEVIEVYSRVSKRDQRMHDWIKASAKPVEEGVELIIMISDDTAAAIEVSIPGALVGPEGEKTFNQDLGFKCSKGQWSAVPLKKG